jgi:hypothetical protein
MMKPKTTAPILFPALPVLGVAGANGQDALRYRFQLYDEESGRLDVESHYLDLEHRWGSTTFGLRLAIDSLSGMTPTGTHARGDEDDWLFQFIEDERRVAVVTVEQEVDDYTLTFEYAHSKEVDYRSNALTAKASRQFFEKNTTVTAGVTYAFDKVLATPFTNNFDNENKDTFDLSLGVSQILGRNTLFDFNCGYGYNRGYLSDPYRRISQIRTIIIDGPFGSFPVTDTFDYAENRPDELHRFVTKASLRHYIEPANAAVKGSYRFFANSFGIQGHTFEIKWIQQVGNSFSVTPYLRYYRQSGADFYLPTLTGSGIDGTGAIDGSTPNYSSDYRLSEMEAFTYGFRIAWEPRPDLTVDLQLERYEMSGLDARTPASFFPTANVISVGVQWSF